MVLCAVSADHSHIKLLEAPGAAKAGDRITFPGFSGEPASSAQMAKKKILEKLAPQVKILTGYVLFRILFLILTGAYGLCYCLIFSSCHFHQLRTDSKGVAHWGSCAFTVGKIVDLNLFTAHRHSLKLLSLFSNSKEIYNTLEIFKSHLPFLF